MQIGDCKMSPWAVVSLEWPWAYGSTWVLFCQIRCWGMFVSDGVGGIPAWIPAFAGMTWEGAGMVWEGAGVTGGGGDMTGGGSDGGRGCGNGVGG